MILDFYLITFKNIKLILYFIFLNFKIIFLSSLLSFLYYILNFIFFKSIS